MDRMTKTKSAWLARRIKKYLPQMTAKEIAECIIKAPDELSIYFDRLFDKALKEKDTAAMDDITDNGRYLNNPLYIGWEMEAEKERKAGLK